MFSPFPIRMPTFSCSAFVAPPAPMASSSLALTGSLRQTWSTVRFAAVRRVIRSTPATGTTPPFLRPLPPTPLRPFIRASPLLPLRMVLLFQFSGVVNDERWYVKWKTEKIQKKSRDCDCDWVHPCHTFEWKTCVLPQKELWLWNVGVEGTTTRSTKCGEIRELWSWHYSLLISQHI